VTTTVASDDGEGGDGVVLHDLVVSLERGVLRILIDRPAKANSFTADLLRSIVAVLEAPPAEARVVLLGSTGDRVFCAGMDLEAMVGDATGFELHRSRGVLRDAVLALRGCPLPVVARVQGTCLAGGVALALASDLVVCSDTAEWGLPEIDRAIWPFMVGALLGHHVSPKHAMDWMLTGRRFDAREAQGAGLVSRVVPAAELDDEVDALLQVLVAKAPLAVELGKAAFYDAVEMPLRPGLEAMQAQLSVLLQSEDAAEGVASFFERRDPLWRGR
jgi:methylglutaconyl-CoA hydratase